jgi:hypothetical protein
MEEQTKLVIVQAGGSINFVGSCWRKQRCKFPAERNHVGIDTADKSMLLILDIISITQVTVRELLSNSG